MSFENLRAGIDLLVNSIRKRPEHAAVLQEQLRDKLAEMRDLGLPLPEDLQRMEEWLEQDEAPGDFDNMPV